MKQRILANCYECTGMYTDGRKDCEMEECTFHVYMPYRKGRRGEGEAHVGGNEEKLREARQGKGAKIKSVVVA